MLLGSAAALFSWFAGSEDDRGGDPDPFGGAAAPVAPRAAEGTPDPASVEAPPSHASTDPPLGASAGVSQRTEVGPVVAVGLTAGTRQSLEGLVVGGGAPLAGAQVLFTERSGEALCEATTGSGGRFVLPVPRPLEDGLIVVHARGYAPLETGPFAIRAGERRFVGNLQVASGVPLSGKVVTPDGRNLGGADVQLRAGGPSGGFNRFVQRTTTDRLGAFRFAEAPVGTVRVEAFAEGYGSRAQELRHDGQGRGVTVTLVPERLMVLHLHDGEGRGVPEARIQLRPHDPNSAPLQATSDQAGDSVIQGLGSELWEVRIEAQGYRPAVRDRVVADGQRVEFELTRWPCVAGRVTAPGGAALPADLTVLPLTANARGGFIDSGRYTPTPVGPDGRFEICDLRPGVYAIRAQGEGYAASTSSSVRVTLGRDVDDLRVELKRGGSLVIRVRASGRLLSGVPVEIYDATPPPQELFRTPATPAVAQAAAPVARASTGADGSVTFENLAAGPYWCLSRPSGFVAQVTGPEQVRDGQSTQARTVEAKKGGTLEGTVRLASGDAAAGAAVHLFGESGVTRTPIQLESDDQGRWRSPVLPGGEYRVTARIVFGRPATARTATARTRVQVDKAVEVELAFSGN